MSAPAWTPSTFAIWWDPLQLRVERPVQRSVDDVADVLGSANSHRASRQGPQQPSGRTVNVHARDQGERRGLPGDPWPARHHQRGRRGLAGVLPGPRTRRTPRSGTGRRPSRPGARTRLARPGRRPLATASTARPTTTATSGCAPTAARSARPIPGPAPAPPARRPPGARPAHPAEQLGRRPAWPRPTRRERAAVQGHGAWPEW